MANEFKWYGITHTKLNNDIVLKMIDCGMRLYTLEDSCRVCDITYSTYRNWMKKAEKEIEEFGDIQDQLLKSFYHAHAQGKSMSLSKIAEKVMLDALNDSDLGLKVLERHSEQWSNKIKSTVDVKSETVVKHDFTGMTIEEKKEAIKLLIQKDMGNNEPSK